ncbi:MAG: three-Cys-motif partner protein TcmP [Armatimonadota bacterium]
MGTDKFFDETREQSAVKAAIVSKYFWAWAKTIIPTAKKMNNRIAYIDLFAGPGRYSDDTKSTPLLVLEQAIKDPDMCRMLVTIFNDKDPANCGSLEASISEIPGIDKLDHPPIIMNQEVGEEIVKQFEKHKLVPTLFFVDPWGYKGLSLRLVNSVLKDWGCDCIFFFNYNRINMGLENELVKEHMDALFGIKRADDLRAKLEPLSPFKREIVIVEEIAQALTEMGAEFVLPFCFRNDSGSKTSHHLIFVTKHFLGYHMMKGIMAGESTKRVDSLASFQYCPADRSQPMLFGLLQPVESLEKELLKAFAGRTLSMDEIYRSHSVGTPFIGSDYKTALRKLMEGGKITTNRVPKKGTFSGDILVSFPKE